MPTRAPEETDILCESCGYMLNGLPPSGKCPECGSPIDLSISERLRQPPLWENIGSFRSTTLAFLRTSSQIIFQPTHFFRTSTTRGPLSPARHFAQIHWVISSLLIGLAAWDHWKWFETKVIYKDPSPLLRCVMFLALPVITFIALAGTIHLAARLTTWEGTYRGYRLPRLVVLRVLYYHAAHIFLVALLALITCVGYISFLRDRLISPWMGDLAYLWTLCGEVIVAAVYLFYTYWIGMKNSMYANR
jgi:hypothetical protein